MELVDDGFLAVLGGRKRQDLAAGVARFSRIFSKEQSVWESRRGGRGMETRGTQPKPIKKGDNVCVWGGHLDGTAHGAHSGLVHGSVSSLSHLLAELRRRCEVVVVVVVKREDGNEERETKKRSS